MAKEVVIPMSDADLTVIVGQFADEVTIKQSKDVIVLDPEEARMLAEVILESTNMPELTKDEQDKLDDLAKKWNYQPERRLSNVAGFKKASIKQRGYIFRLAQRSDEDYQAFQELSFIVEKYNGISPMQWLSSDAMFIINGLTRGEQEMRGNNQCQR